MASQARLGLSRSWLGATEEGVKMMRGSKAFDEEDTTQETTAILNCLEYLRREAINTGLHDAAQLIGLAAQSVSEAIARQEELGTAGANIYPGFGRSGPH